MALGQHSEHGDHGDHCVCVGLCPCLWGSTVTILIVGRVSWNQLCVRVRKKKEIL